MKEKKKSKRITEMTNEEIEEIYKKDPEKALQMLIDELDLFAKEIEEGFNEQNTRNASGDHRETS